MLSLEQLAVRAGVPSGDSTTCTLLKGGLSHRIIRADVDDRSYLVRVLDPAVSEAGLGIPLEQEIENTVRAARTGVGPRVFNVAAPSMVLEYLDADTLSARDVRDPGTIPRIALACRRLHTRAEPFVNDFDIFRKAEELLSLCHRHELRIPDGYPDHRAVIAEIERALRRRPLPRVPCHNDLLPENFMDDGTDIRIIDYQLSGMNDPAFELGDIAAEADYSPDLVEALVKAYFGGAMSDALLARARLYLVASNYAWTLWFSVHHGLLSRGGTDFDYWAEAADKWAQAVRDLESAELGGLIDAVGGPQ